MMFTLTSLLLLRLPVAAPADTLHCRIAAGQGKQRCTIEVPAGRHPAGCPAGAKGCRKLDGKRYQIWYAEQDGADCKLSRKHANWTRKVTLKRKDKSTAVGSCTLSMVVE